AAKWLLFSTVISVGMLVVVSAPASSGADAAQSVQPIRLSNKDLRQVEALKKSGVEVFLPTYVPPRFSLKDFTVSKSEGDLDYAIQFCDSKKLCFSVESAATGIGDGP